MANNMSYFFSNACLTLHLMNLMFNFTVTCLKHECSCGEGEDVGKANESTKKDLFYFRYTMDEMEDVFGRLEERMRRQQGVIRDVEGVLKGGVEKRGGFIFLQFQIIILSTHELL